MSAETPEQQLDAIYAELPTVACVKCHRCCGMIPMTRLEWNRIAARLGYAPAHWIMPLFAESGQPLGEAVVTKTAVCPMLQDGRCSVYDIRPFICRLWGTTLRTRCLSGAKPAHWVSDYDAFRLHQRLSAVQ